MSIISEKVKSIRSSETPLIVTLAVSLFVLSMVDAVCTHIGTHLGLIEEANPFMREAIEVSVLFMYAWKIVWGLLFIYLSTKIPPNSAVVKWLAIIALSLYIAVTGMHIFWIFLAL